jgi:hypothetical protein
MPDETSRFSDKAQMIDPSMGCSMPSNFTVLPEIAVAQVRRDAPFGVICQIGCGVATAVGAVINTAPVTPGAKVIVRGQGGIGLNVIQGARMVGADKIGGVAINPDAINPDMAPWSKRFGMTLFVNPKEVAGDIVAHLVALTDGGAGDTLDSTGNTALAPGAAGLPPGLGPVHRDRAGRGGPRDQHPALPAGHGAGVEAFGPWRALGLDGWAEDRGVVCDGQNPDRPDDHPPPAAGADRGRLRPDARRPADPVGGGVLTGGAPSEPALPIPPLRSRSARGTGQRRCGRQPA